jgi:hypothetical protein
MFHQLAEGGFRYADELDYLVRGWVMRHLQADYDLAPIPEHLAALVRDFERSG